MGLRSDQASDSTRLRLVSRGSVGGWPHVVIVGAGFGGLTAAKGLAKAAVEVTLIDRENHHLFQPLAFYGRLFDFKLQLPPGKYHSRGSSQAERCCACDPLSRMEGD